MSDLFRETAFGHALRWVTKRKVLLYPEERSTFIPPTTFASKPLTAGEEKPRQDLEGQTAAVPASGRSSITLTELAPITLVDWYDEKDPDNPMNWSSYKKGIVTFLICFLTFSVYVGSSLIVSGFPSLVEQFGIVEEEASVTLSVYVFCYGLGAMVFSPLSEIPQLGRNPFYVAPMIAFTALQVGAATTPTFPGLVILRALTAFMGSPVLSSGGATLADMYTPFQLPLVFAVWLLPAFAAPALGPIFGNYVDVAHGWTWTMWELLWLVGTCTILIFFLLPETSHDNILLRRAERLRKLTGNQSYRSQSEVSQELKTPKAVLFEALVRPIQITFQDPSIFFANAYVSAVYSTYYAKTYRFSSGSEKLSLGMACFVRRASPYLTTREHKKCFVSRESTESATNLKSFRRRRADMSTESAAKGAERESTESAGDL